MSRWFYPWFMIQLAIGMLRHAKAGQVIVPNKRMSKPPGQDNIQLILIPLCKLFDPVNANWPNDTHAL